MNRLLFLATLALCPVLSADGERLARLLPADTDLVLLINDVADWRANAESSPFGQAWRDPEVQAWLAPLRERMDWEGLNDAAKARAGASPEEVFSWIEGAGLLAVRDFRTVAEQTQAEGELGFVVVVEFGSNEEKIADFFTALTRRRIEEDDFEYTEQSVGAIAVHDLRPPVVNTPEDSEAEMSDEEAEDVEAEEDPAPPVCWAIHDGILVVSPSKAEVLAVVDALQERGSGGSFAASPRYARLAEDQGPAELMFTLRFPRLIEMMQQALAASQGAAPNPMIPPASAIVAGLGLDRWEELWMVTGTEDGLPVGEYGLDYSAPQGLLSLLETNGKPFPQPAWVPAHWRNVASYRFDVGQFVPRLLGIVSAVSPPIGGMAQGMLAQVGQKTGVDVQRDLLGRLGDELITTQRWEAVNPPADNPMLAMNQVPTMLAMSVQDGAAFGRALETLINSGGPGTAQLLKTREYLGQKITTFTPPAPPPDAPPGSAPQPVHYAVTDQYFFVAVGVAAPLEEALQAMSRPGESFWDRPDVREALRWAPDNSSVFQIQDLASVFEVLVPAVDAALAMSAAAPDEDTGEEPETPERWTDPEATPSRGTFRKYFGDSWSAVEQDGNGIRAIGRMRPPSR